METAKQEIYREMINRFLSYLRGMETKLLHYYLLPQPVLILPTRNGNFDPTFPLSKRTIISSYPTYEEWKHIM